jgi:hypothetical protein
MLSDDLDAARHIFGYIASELGLFQTIGAIAFFLVVLACLKRWGYA